MKQIFLFLSLFLTINCWTQSYITLENKDGQAVLEKLVMGDYFSKQYVINTAEISLLKGLNLNLNKEISILTRSNENLSKNLSLEKSKYIQQTEHFKLIEKALRKKNRKSRRVVGLVGVAIGLTTAILISN